MKANQLHIFEIEQVVHSFEDVKADSEKEVIGVPGVEETKLVEDATLLPARSDDLEGVVIKSLPATDPPDRTEPSSDCHRHATGWGKGSSPNFFSHPNGTVIRVLSRKNNQTILERPPTLIQLSERFTNDA